MAQKRKLSTYQKLERAYKKAAKMANNKLKELERSGLRSMNMQMARKWDIMLKDSTIKYVNTNTKRFMASPSTKHNKWMSAQELKSATATLMQFATNRYTSVEYTRAYVDDLKERLGVESDSLVREVFKVFREFGFEGRYDSSTILSNIAEWSQSNYGYMGDILQEFIDEYNENMSKDTPPMDTDILANKISDMVTNMYDYEDNTGDLSQEEKNEIARLRSLEAMDEEEPETISWDNF